MFPEIDYDKVDQIRGLNVVICTTARTDDEARTLLKGFDMPFSGRDPKKEAEEEVARRAAVEAEKQAAREAMKEVEKNEGNWNIDEMEIKKEIEANVVKNVDLEDYLENLIRKKTKEIELSN